MLNGIECLGHSTIKITKASKTIYIDPYNIKEVSKDANIVFITHSHYDHYSPQDISKIINENTIMVITEDLYSDVQNLGINKENLITVKPNETFEISNIKVSTIPAYNTNKKFHPKENNWVGYILELENTKYYIAGDTDITEENKQVKCNVAFVPVGGTFTMTAKEAADLINKIKPQIAIPIHYGSIVGTEQDAIDFKNYLNSNIECEILM